MSLDAGLGASDVDVVDGNVSKIGCEQISNDWSIHVSR